MYFENYNVGSCLKLEHLVERLPESLEHVKQDVALIQDQLTEAKASVNTPFEYEQELSQYLKRQVEIDTKLEFDRSKQEDIVSGENEITENVKEVLPMREDKKGLNVNPMGENIVSQQNELFDAVKEKNEQKLKKLLDAGLYPDIYDEEQKTPLYYAVVSGDKKTARLLIDTGADPELCAMGRNLTEYCKDDGMRMVLQKRKEIYEPEIDQTQEEKTTRGRNL